MVVLEEEVRLSFEDDGGMDEDGWLFNGARRRARVSLDASCHATDGCLGGGAEVRDLNSSYRLLRGSTGLARR